MPIEVTQDPMSVNQFSDAFPIIKEHIDGRLKQMQSEILETIKMEEKLITFEVLSGLCVKRSRKIAKIIKDKRSTLWKACLKKSNGDADKAAEMFYAQYYQK